MKTKTRGATRTDVGEWVLDDCTIVPTNAIVAIGSSRDREDSRGYRETVFSLTYAVDENNNPMKATQS